MQERELVTISMLLDDPSSELSSMHPNQEASCMGKGEVIARDQRNFGKTGEGEKISKAVTPPRGEEDVGEEDVDVSCVDKGEANPNPNPDREASCVSKEEGRTIFLRILANGRVTLAQRMVSVWYAI